MVGDWFHFHPVGGVLLFFPFQSQSLARHTTADAGATVSEVSQGMLRCLGGGISQGDAVGYPGGLSCIGGSISQGDVGIALTF